MNDGVGFLDSGEDLVWRYCGSGLTRKEFVAEAGIAATTVDCDSHRVNWRTAAEEASVSRILPVDLNAAEHEEPAARGEPSAVLVRVGKGLAVEVRGGFGAQLLRDPLAVLETPVAGGCG